MRSRASYALRPSRRSSIWRARRSDASTRVDKSLTCFRFWMLPRSIGRYWIGQHKAKSAISRMRSSSSPRGKCRPRSFLLATRETLRSHRFLFTPRVRFRSSLTHLHRRRVDSRRERVAPRHSLQSAEGRLGVRHRYRGRQPSGSHGLRLAADMNRRMFAGETGRPEHCIPNVGAGSQQWPRAPAVRLRGHGGPAGRAHPLRLEKRLDSALTGHWQARVAEKVPGLRPDRDGRIAWDQASLLNAMDRFWADTATTP